MAALPAAVVALAPMRRADLPDVVAIDALASPRPWSLSTFRTELARGDRGYLVARLGSADGEAGGGTAGGSAEEDGAGGSADDGTDGRADDDRAAVRDVGGGTGVVGFAGVALFPEEAHVMAIAVDPRLQGRGIGAELVSGLLGIVARADLDAVTLEVRESNLAARRLYRHAGFADAGVRPAYYPDGEGAVIMWRRRGVEVS